MMLSRTKMRGVVALGMILTLALLTGCSTSRQAGPMRMAPAMAPPLASGSAPAIPSTAGARTSLVACDSLGAWLFGRDTPGDNTLTKRD